MPRHSEFSCSAFEFVAVSREDQPAFRSGPFGCVAVWFSTLEPPYCLYGKAARDHLLAKL